MKKTRRLLAGLLSLSLLLCLMPIRSLAADVLTLSSVELSGLAVPVEGQYAVSVDASRVVPGLPEAYQVAEDSLSWKDQYGTVIDNERYAFEAGRIYVLDLTLRVTNPENYSFGSKVTAVLTGLSSSDYTSKVSYVSKEEIQVELRFTVAGSRTYPDVTEIYLSGQTEPVVGEKPISDFEVPYGNFSLKSAIWSGELGSGKFVASNTYCLTVKLTGNIGYTFAKDAVIRLDGRKPTSVTVSQLGNNGELTAVFEYYVSAKKEIGVITVSGGLQRPLAGEQSEKIAWNELELPYAAEYKLKHDTINWNYANDRVLSIGDRFCYGVTYRATLVFELKDPDTRVFTENPRVYVKNIPDWMYEAKVVKSEASELTVEIFAKADFKGSDGFTKENPVRCYSFEDLKGALESETIRYVSLMDIPDAIGDDLPNPPKGSESEYFYFIMTYGTKELSLDGDAVLRSNWGEKSGYKTVGGLIYNTGNLTVTGEGSLTYLAPVSSGYNAVIVNRENLTVESGTLVGYVDMLNSVNSSGQVTSHDKHGCALYQKRDGAKLTINGGTFLTMRYAKDATEQAAVVIEGGTATVTEGTFDYEVRYGLQDTGCYGLLIKNDAARVTLSGGTFRHIRFASQQTPGRFIASGCKVKANNANVDLTSATYGWQGMVQVFRVAKELDVYINAPAAGESPAYSIYEWNHRAVAYGGTAGIRWQDLTDNKDLTAADSFIPGHRYRVRIQLEAVGSTLFAVDAAYKPAVAVTLNRAPAIIRTVGDEKAEQVLEIEYTFDACPAVISYVDVTVQPPFEGRTAPSGATFGGGGYGLYSLDWEDVTEDRFMYAGESFKKGHAYRVQVWIKAADGYEFKTDKNLDPDLTGTLNGQTVAVGRAYDQSADEVVCITYHFGICDTTVDFVSVFNLDIPKPGATPDFDAAVQEMEKYEIAHLRWTGPEGLMLENDRFQPGETYEVEIKLVPLKMEGQLLYSFASGLQGYLNARQLDSSDVFASSKEAYLYRRWTCPETASAVGLSGSVTSYLDTAGSVTLELYGPSSQTPDYVTGTTTGSYRFAAVAVGSYTLVARKANHGTRVYSVTLSGNDRTVDVKLCPIGDVTGDGKVNIMDVAKLYAHVKGTPITDEYALTCGDTTGDGKYNIMDVAKLYAHVKGVNKLY